ncbi:MAG: hypothetical protein AAB354_13750 [candidate division KSB1 bacterium]
MWIGKIQNVRSKTFSAGLKASRCCARAFEFLIARPGAATLTLRLRGKRFCFFEEAPFLVWVEEPRRHSRGRRWKRATT